MYQVRLTVNYISKIHTWALREAAGPEPWLTSSTARGIWGKEAKGTVLNEDSFQNGV